MVKTSFPLKRSANTTTGWKNGEDANKGTCTARLERVGNIKWKEDYSPL